MPVKKLQFKPGVNRESTTYAAEGGWFDMDKIRFRSGFPQKLGGWAALSANTFNGVARHMINWVTLNYFNLVGIGTNCKFYIENGGTYNDITPLTAASPVALAAAPFATTNLSRLVTVTIASHGMSPGTYVTFSGAAAVAGLTLNGEFEAITCPTGNTITIIAPTAANATTTGGGGAVTANIQIAAGNSVYSVGNGWGAGTWGGLVSGGASTGWGAASVVGIGQQLRIWSSDNFGQDLVLAPRGGAIYYWTVDTSTYARAITLVGDGYVPTATLKVISSDIQRFVIALGANSYLAGNPNTAFDPMLVRWSDQESATTWIPAPTNQAGEYKLTSGSTIVTGRTARQEILIWTDSALFSMQYLGPPYTFGFTLLMDNISIISPQATVTANNTTFWMGLDKFYNYSGRVDTLPCTLRSYIFGDINMSQAYQIISGSNEGFNEVWWFYPSADSNVCNRYVIYNHLENIWYFGNLQRTAWLDSPLRSFPMAAISVQNSYLLADIGASDVNITVINGVSYPDENGTLQIDSEQITYADYNNNTFTGCVRGVNGTTSASHTQYTQVMSVPTNQIIYHENGVDDYSLTSPVAIESFIESADFDISDGDRFGFVWRMLPDVTFEGSTVAAPSVTISLLPRQNSGTQYRSTTQDQVVSSNSYLPGANQPVRTYTVQLFTGQVYTRARGRQMAFRIDSSDVGVAWQLGAPRIDIRPDGRR